MEQEGEKRISVWAFYTDEEGERRYNRVCEGCERDCKQSFRAGIVACPRYRKKESVAER